jgi:hypothetical protein
MGRGQKILYVVLAAFFLVAAIPTFVFLRERGVATPLPPGESLVGVTAVGPLVRLPALRHR